SARTLPGRLLAQGRDDNEAERGGADCETRRGKDRPGSGCAWGNLVLKVPEEVWSAVRLIAPTEPAGRVGARAIVLGLAPAPSEAVPSSRAGSGLAAGALPGAVNSWTRRA